MLQSQIGTAPDLGSVANYTFYYNSPAPPISTNYMDMFISPLYPTSPQSVAFVLVAPLSCNRSPPPLPEQSAVHLDVTHTHHPPASTSLIYAPHRVPASVLCPVNVLPPPFCLWPDPRFLSAPGWFYHHEYLRNSMNLPLTP